MTRSRETTAPRTAAATFGGANREAQLTTSGMFSDVSGLYADELPESGGLPPLTELRAMLNRLSTRIDTRHDWDRVRIAALNDLLTGLVLNKAAALRQTTIASTGAGSYRIPRTDPVLGGTANNGYVIGVNRFSTDGGITWVLTGFTFNLLNQMVTFSGPPANGVTITIELNVMPYQGVGTTSDVYEVLSASPDAYITTAGSGTNTTSNDSGTLFDVLAARLPNNDYGNYFNSGLVKHDEWFTRQPIGTPEVVGSGAELTLLSVPLTTLGGRACLLPGSFIKGSTPNSRTRGLGYAIDANSNPIARAVGRSLTATIARLVFWPILVRRESDGQVLLGVNTDSQYSSSAVTLLGSSNTAAFDVFPLVEAIYV